MTARKDGLLKNTNHAKPNIVKSRCKFKKFGVRLGLKNIKMFKHVYVMLNPELGIVKIGVSSNVNIRKNRVSANCGCKVTVTYKTPLTRYHFFIERKTHRLLKNYRRCGEWFNISPDKAKSVIEKVISKPRFEKDFKDHAEVSMKILKKRRIEAKKKELLPAKEISRGWYKID